MWVEEAGNPDLSPAHRGGQLGGEGINAPDNFTQTKPIERISACFYLDRFAYFQQDLV